MGFQRLDLCDCLESDRDADLRSDRGDSHLERACEPKTTFVVDQAAVQ